MDIHGVTAASDSILKLFARNNVHSRYGILTDDMPRFTDADIGDIEYLCLLKSRECAKILGQLMSPDFQLMLPIAYIRRIESVCRLSTRSASRT